VKRLNSLRRAALIILLILLSGVTISATLNPKPVRADPASFTGWAGYCTGGSNCDTSNDASVGFTCTYSTCTVPVCGPSVCGSPPTQLSGGSGPGQLSFPSEIAFDPTGNLWVADNNGIEKFTGSPLAWSYVQPIPTSIGDGRFSTSCGLTTDPSCIGGIAFGYDSHGNAVEYISDPGNNRVQRFLPSYESLVDGFDYWLGACADDALMTNSGCNYAGVNPSTTLGHSFGFSCDTSLCGSYAEHGSGPGQFYDPTGLAVDSSGNLYVVDTFNNRVQKFTNAGTYVSQLGCAPIGPTPVPSAPACTAGSGNGEFHYPTHVAVDSSGNVYVVDSGNNRVEKFDSSGHFLLAWGTLGAGDDQFNYPTGIAVDALGNVYVTDSGNDRVWRFDSFGDCCGGVKGGAWAGACDEGYPINPTTGTVDCDTPAGPTNSLHSTGFSCYNDASACYGGVSYASDGDGQFDDTGYYGVPEYAGVAVDFSGNVYVADYWNSRVELFTPPKTLITDVGLGQGSATPNCPAPTGCSEAVGSSISVTATAGSGYMFSSWTVTGASCSGGSISNPCTFTMPSNGVTVSATFTITVTGTPQVSAGTLSGFTAVPLASEPTPPPAEAGSFPAGVLSFTVSGLPDGGTATVTITLSSPLPPGAFSYWKFHGGVWMQLPASKATLDSTRTVITLTLTDGATPDDSDGVANGVIVDPGGPAIFVPCTSSGGGSFNYCKLSLVQGWNLISLPVVPNSTAITAAQLKYTAYQDFFTGPSNSVNNIFNSTGLASVTSVWTYNGKTWLFCTVSDGSCSGSLTTMVDGSGYWVFTTSNTVVLSFGGWIIQQGSAPPAYTLVQGWNLVGFKPQPTIAPETVGPYLSSVTGDYNANNVWLYDNQAGTWIRATGSTPIPVGEALWVYTTAPATLTP